MKTVKLLHLYLLGLLLLLFACKKDSPDPAPPTPPTPVAPSNLAYSTNSLSTCKGTSKSSVVPTITGSTPLTYEATVNPTNAGITIGSDGKITASGSAIAGTFKVSVKVSNSAGNQTFTDIYTITINEGNSSGVNYDEEVLNLVTTKCTPCHTTGAQPKWNDYNTAKANINNMIARVKSGSMPQGGPALSAAEIKILEDWLANCLIK